MYLPKKQDVEAQVRAQAEHQKFLLDKKSQCQEDGEKLRRRIATELYGDRNSLEGLYAYNEDLNTCLFRGGWARENLIGKHEVYHWIMDTYSQKELATSYLVDFTHASGLPIEQFDLKMEELMGYTLKQD